MNLLDDPSQVGAMSLGLRLLSTPGKFGQALGTAGLGAMADVQQAKAAQDIKRQKALQEQMLMMQLEQIKAQQQRQQGIEGAYRGAIESPATQALAGGGGPTVANAQAMEGLTPRVNQSKLIEGLLGADPIAAYQMMQPKERRYEKVGDALLDVTDGVTEAYRAPEKAEKPPTSVQEFLYAQQDPRFAEWDLRRKRAGATSVNVDTRPLLTKAQERVDTEFAQTYADFVASGGVADVTKQLGQLRGVSSMLAKDDSLTGPIRGQLPESIRSITNPRAVEARNAVEEVVQRNLRLVLGAQFTEKEGERLIARAYNPLLSSAENKRRVDRLAQQIESAALAKVDAARYYEQNGTLQGWRGKLPTIKDIEAGLDAPQTSLQDLLKKYGD
jgi:hypothetical protein